MLACGRNVRFCVFAKPILGIDVSHYQGKIDWAAVAHSGIQFAFLKATEGCGPADSRFRENWIAAGNAGILRGAYPFSSIPARMFRAGRRFRQDGPIRVRWGIASRAGPRSTP